MSRIIGWSGVDMVITFVPAMRIFAIAHNRQKSKM